MFVSVLPPVREPWRAFASGRERARLGVAIRIGCRPCLVGACGALPFGVGGERVVCMALCH